MNSNEDKEEKQEAATNPIVCFCYAVRREALQEAIAQGACTLRDLQAATCASTGCGGCEWEVIALLEKELEKEHKKH